MCGIAGYIRATQELPKPSQIGALMRSLRARGPDDEGACFIDRERGAVLSVATSHTRAAIDLPRLQPHEGRAAGAAAALHDLALLHTRYSIIDLSDAAHQPFRAADGAVVAVFNGEIYNYRELRGELEREGVVFRTRSDTEVLVEGYVRWGEALWGRMNGFWAVALHDTRDGSTVLCRDRMGVAPLYLRETRQGLFFSSDLRALIAADPEPAAPNLDIVRGFVETSTKDFGTQTCFVGIHSVPPASWMRFGPRDHRREQARVERYWSLPSERWSNRDISLPEATTRLRDILMSAVELRLRADVKVAFELSGGLDSSSIVAAAATLRGSDITTYTIEVPEQNEEPYARAILERYPVDYRVLRKAEERFFHDSDEFVDAMEEPFHSPNIYTHYKMRQLMKGEGVHAVLSGSGGDEALAGYEARFGHAARRQQLRTGDVVGVARHQLARLLHPETTRPTLLGSAASLRRSAVRRLGALGISPWRDNAAPASGSSAAVLLSSYDTLPFHAQQRYHFEVGLLPYYLRSNDHFTMAIPLEHRFPFLDYRLVELGLQVPVGYLFRDGWTKYLLRKAMEPLLPEKILWRRQKMGFPFPIASFLSTHHARLLPAFTRGAQFIGERASEDAFTAMAARDPHRAWRTCSTGMWLQRFAGGRATEASALTGRN